MITSIRFTDRCRAECTSNVIFLFQSPEWIYTGFPHVWDGDYGHDGEGILLGDTDGEGHWEPRADSEYLSSDELEDMETCDGVPCAVQRWQTVRVFLTREEGNAFGESQSHNYREGWRVYGIPASGALVDLLKET